MHKPSLENREDNHIIDKRHLEILEEIAEKSKTHEHITYFFENRDTNPLKNVIMNQMIKNDYTAYHRHDFLEINYCAEGVLYEHVGRKSFIMKPGDILIMSPAIFHACYSDEKATCYNLLFKKEWVANVAKGFAVYDPANYLTNLVGNSIYTIINLGKDSQELSEHIEKLAQMNSTLNHHVDLYENLSLENSASDFLLSLTKFTRHEYSEIQVTGKTVPQYTPDDMVKYINDNFDKITLPDTASRFGYSRSQFHRILKENTGKSFSELILSIRMQRARHYLLNTNLPIKNIAYLLGLDSAEHFTRMFKRNRGMTPKEYRDSFMRSSIKNK